MLDEKLEYDSYLTRGYNGLLRSDNLKDGLKGIRRPLTVLARGILDACRENEITDKEQQDQYATAFLKTWTLGTLEQDNMPPAVLRTHFERATTASLLQHLIDKKDEIKKSEAYLRQRVKDWSEPLFNKPEKNGGHSLNEICFKSIIADAMLQGPLKNEVLTLRRFPSNFNLKGDLNYHHKEQLLSIVAMCMQRKSADCNSIPITLADLSNYMNKACNKGGDKIYQSVSPFIEKAGYAYEGRPLFVKDCLADSYTKLTVDAKWLKDFDVHLVPAGTFIPDEYTWYNDDRLRRS